MNPALGPSMHITAAQRFTKIVLAIIVCLLACCGSAKAQGVTVKTVVTDQNPLNLANTFGPPVQGFLGQGMDQAGNFAFMGHAQAAIFFRPVGQSPQRLLQIGDAVPNIPGSQIAFFTALIGSHPTILFGVEYELSDGFAHNALLTYSSSTKAYAVVATDQQTAPGTGGLTFGTGLTPVGIDDNGDVAFVATPGGLLRSLFITTGGGAPQLVAKVGDPVPTGAGSATIVSLASLTTSGGMDAAGQVLIQAQVFSPTEHIEPGLFLASSAGLSAVAVPTLSQGAGAGCLAGTLQSFVGATLGSSGVVAFSETISNNSLISSGVCYQTPGSAPSTAAFIGEMVPNSGGVAFGFLGNVSPVLDGSGNIFFAAPVSGAAPIELLRFDGTNLTVVASVGEAAPGVQNETFASFTGLSAANGTVTFLASFAGDDGIGLYQQSASGAPLVLVTQEDAAVPLLPGSVTLDLSQTVTTTTSPNNQSVLFSAFLVGGPANQYEATITASGSTQNNSLVLQPLVTTADPLPAGYRVDLPLRSGGGNFVQVVASNGGGPVSIFLADLTAGTVSKIIGEGDNLLASPVSGLSLAGGAVNSSGRIAFPATIYEGGLVVNGIFAGTSSSTLAKIVATGDALPGGSTFVNTVSVTSNNSGQFSFIATTLSSSSLGQGIFRINTDGTITKIVASGDPGPSGGAFSAFSSQFLNASGQVAFEGTSGLFGIYVGDGTAIPQPAALQGDTVGGAGLTSFEGVGGLGNDGTVVFDATAMSPSSSSSFVIGAGKAPDTTPPSAIAENGAAAPIPGGGTLSFFETSGQLTFTNSIGFAQSNQENDVVFGASVLGNTATSSGYFIDRGAGPQAGILQPLLLQGQSVPGGEFGPVGQPGVPTGTIVLGPDGEALSLHAVTSGSSSQAALFLVGTNGSITRVIGTGDAELGGTINGFAEMTPGNAGTFAFQTTITTIPNGTGNVVTAILAVEPLSTSSTAVVSSLNPATTGHSVTFTATVSSSAAGTPTGTVTFFDGTTALGPAVALTGDTAALSTSALASGSHSITAQYSGDTNFAPSTSSPVAQQVNGLSSSSTTLVSSSNPAAAGKTVTFTATVTSSSVGGATPTGTVTFFDGTTALTGLVALGSNAVAPFSTSTLAVGSHSITAKYTGDAAYDPSTSSVLMQVVSTTPPPSFTATANPTSLTITAGQSGQVVVTITPVNGSTQTVSITCTGLPAGASCQVVPPSVTLDGTHTATMTITISTTAHTANAVAPGFRGPIAPFFRNVVPIVIGVAMLLCILLFSRKRLTLAIAACFLLGFISLAAGCGNGNTTTPSSPGLNPTTGTPAGTYNSSVTVSAGANSSSALAISITIN